MDTTDEDCISEEEIYLELSDLPLEVAIGLERYLSVKYPKQNVVIHRGPKSIYGHLLPELQGKIMKYNMDEKDKTVNVEERNPALYTTKIIKSQTARKFYKKECDKPISIDEIEKEVRISLDEDLSRVLMINNDLWDMYIYSPYFDNSGDYPYVEFGVGMNVGIEVDDDPDLVIIDYRDLGGQLRDDLESGLNEGDIDIDPFSEYRIRIRRGACMEYNKNYAKEYLINWYNKFVSPDLGNKLAYDDVKLVAMLNYITFEILPYLESMEPFDTLTGMSGELNLLDENEVRTQLAPYFEFSREKLRDYIIQLTGAKVVKNTNKLVL